MPDWGDGVEMREQRHVLFYYRPGCGECAEAKEFLDRSGARYMGFDISKDEEALRDLEERWGCSDCATLVIDGELFAGFHANIDKIQKLLGGVDPLETAINRACTKALESAFHLMSADFKKHGEIRAEAFELLEESLRLEGWDGAEHRAIIAPRLAFLLHVAHAWVESREELLFGTEAPDDLGQKTVELALKWGRPNSWLLERHRRPKRKAARSKVEHALDHAMIAMLWELPGYRVDDTVDWLVSQDAEVLSDAGERIARLLMREPEPAHLDLGRRFWQKAIEQARTPDSLHGFGWWAEVEALSREDYEQLTLATASKSQGTLDWCVEVAARCAREPVTVAGLEIISRLLRGQHEPWDRSRVADVWVR